MTCQCNAAVHEYITDKGFPEEDKKKANTMHKMCYTYGILRYKPVLKYTHQCIT